MWRIRSAVVRSLVAVVMTCRPSRNTVVVSHRSKTSPRRWLTNRIATPRSRRPRTIVNSRSTSCADSDAVGSSRMRTFASTDSALAISISCWSAIDRPRTSARTSNLTSSSSNSAWAARRVPPQSTVPSGPAGACPMYTFSATLRSGNSRGSWWTTAIPRARAWAGPEMTVGLAVDDDRPRVGLVDAGEDLDQRALARAVLPDQRMDAARAQVERHAGQGLRGCELLADVGEPDAGGSRGLRRDGDRHVAAPLRDQGHLDPAGPQVPDHLGGRAVVGQDRVDLVGAAERRERHPLPLRVVDDRDHPPCGGHHRALDLGLFLGGIGQAGLEGEPGRAHEGGLHVDPLEQAVAQVPDDGHRLLADAPAGHQHGDPRRPGELGGDAQAVGDDRQLAPAALGADAPGDGEAGGAGVHDDRVAVVDEGRGRGADARLLVLLQPLAKVEGRLGPVADGQERAAMGPREAPLALEHVEVLADGDRRDPEPLRELADPDATLLADEPGDLVLAFAGEDIAGRGAGRDGQTKVSSRTRSRGRRGFGLVSTHLVPKRSAMSRN